MRRKRGCRFAESLSLLLGRVLGGGFGREGEVPLPAKVQIESKKLTTGRPNLTQNTREHPIDNTARLQ